MKITQRLAFVGLCSVLPLFTGCKSSGHDQADTTAMHMEDLRTAVDALKQKVAAPATSLGMVVEKAEVDPKTPFAQFTKDVSDLKAAAARADTNLKAMRSDGQAYFAAWEKQAETINDPDLKKTAQERRTRLTKAIEDVAAPMGEAQKELATYSAMVTDLQTYLANDLTPAGIKSVKDKSKRVTKDAESINDKLDDVIKALDKGAPEFKTAKPPPPPPAK